MAISVRTVVQGLRFDGQRIMRTVDRRNTAMLFRFGAFVWRAARSSLRRTKKVSEPGRPPRVHTNDNYATLKNIRFHVDPRRLDVIVGPLKVNGVKGRDITQTLEHGGTSWVKTGRGREAHRRMVRIQRRPFMQPAFDKVIQNRRYLQG